MDTLSHVLPDGNHATAWFTQTPPCNKNEVKTMWSQNGEWRFIWINFLSDCFFFHGDYIAIILSVSPVTVTWNDRWPGKRIPISLQEIAKDTRRCPLLLQWALGDRCVLLIGPQYKHDHICLSSSWQFPPRCSPPKSTESADCELCLMKD